MKRVFNWNYFGYEIKSYSDNSLFQELLMNKFALFNEIKTHTFNKRTIKITFNSGSFVDNVENQKQISNSVRISKNSICIYHTYLTTKTIVETIFSKKDIIKISFHFSTSIIFEVINILTKNRLKKQLFQYIIKLYIEQSLLWNICTKNSLNCLHAASLEENGRVTVFAGLNGVGKSTLSLLLKSKNKKLFSDNYLLVKNDMAYLSPDLIRLDKKSLHILNLKSFSFFGFDKYLVKNTQTFFSKKTKAKIKNIYILSRGNQWKKESLSNKQAINLIKNLQIINAEEVLYAPISQMFGQNRITHTIKARFYELTMATSKDIPYEF